MGLAFSIHSQGHVTSCLETPFMMVGESPVARSSLQVTSATLGCRAPGNAGAVLTGITTVMKGVGSFRSQRCVRIDQPRVRQERRGIRRRTSFQEERVLGAYI